MWHIEDVSKRRPSWSCIFQNYDGPENSHDSAGWAVKSRTNRRDKSTQTLGIPKRLIFFTNITVELFPVIPVSWNISLSSCFVCVHGSVTTWKTWIIWKLGWSLCLPNIWAFSVRCRYRILRRNSTYFFPRALISTVQIARVRQRYIGPANMVIVWWYPCFWELALREISVNWADAIWVMKVQSLMFEINKKKFIKKSSVLYFPGFHRFAEPGVFPLTQALEVTNKNAIKSILISFIQNGAELQIRYSDIILGAVVKINLQIPSSYFW